MIGWISVKDKLPACGDRVLLCVFDQAIYNPDKPKSNYLWITMGSYKCGKWDYGSTFYPQEVTHWMVKPPFPWEYRNTR